MAKMRFVLVGGEEEDTGEMGWRDSRIPRYSQTYGPLSTPFGLAHDLMEHSAFETVGDEIEAHAAMYRIRYETGYCRPGPYGRPMTISDFGFEWENLFRALENGDQLLKPPQTCKLDDEIENDISAIIDQGQAIVKNEFETEFSTPDEIEGRNATLAMLAERFRAYFRIGYRKAGKRYKGIPMYNVSYAYTVLGQAFEKYLAQNQEIYEGQTLHVVLDVQQGRVSIDEVFPEEY